MPVIDECVQFHLSYLPPETSSIVHYEPANSANNPVRLFEYNIGQEAFEQWNREFRRHRKQFFDDVGRATWTLLPLAVNGHFHAVILHTKQKPMPGTKRGYRTIIQNAVVIEPQRMPVWEQFIWGRLRLILTEKRGFTFKHSQPVKLWFPKQNDQNTCGFRVYEILRVMLMRISQSVAEEGLRDGYNPQTIWKDLSGMFLPIYPLSVCFRDPFPGALARGKHYDRKCD